MIECINVTKSYGNQSILDGLTFSVKQGECLGIIGPNGSGKSTLLKLISGLVPSTSGRIYIENKPVGQISRKELARTMAVLAQDALRPVHLSVYDAVMMGRHPHLGWFGQESEKDQKIVNQVLKQTGLVPFRDQYIHTLSGGEKQRVAIAMAMTQEPRLLLLDEPTTFLDIGHQISMLNVVKKWQEECGLTLLMVIHDLNLAAQYCDRLLLLDQGRIKQIGYGDTVLNRESLSEVFQTKAEIVRHPTMDVPQVLLSSR